MCRCAEALGTLLSITRPKKNARQRVTSKTQPHNQTPMTPIMYYPLGLIAALFLIGLVGTRSDFDYLNRMKEKEREKQRKERQRQLIGIINSARSEQDLQCATNALIDFFKKNKKTKNIKSICGEIAAKIETKRSEILLPNPLI